MNFRYRVRDENGNITESKIEAKDFTTALQTLRSQEMLVLSLEETSDRTNEQTSRVSIIDRLRSIGTVPSKAQMIYFRQMATMLKTDLSLPTALEIVASQEQNIIFKNALADILRCINRGIPFSQAMTMHPEIFSSLIIALVQSGEEEGILANAMERVADLLEKQEILKNKIRASMFYPILVILVAITVIVVFIMFILPNFQFVFDQMGIELPRLTQVLFSIGNYFSQYWREITLTIALVTAGILFTCKSRKTKPLMDRVKLKLPIIGPLVLKSSMARATQTLSALTAAGVPILRGLEMAGKTANNTVVDNGFMSLRDSTRKGQPLGEAAQRMKIFPLLVCQMIRIGEETGQLVEMLDRVATWYYQELDAQVRVITSLLEPIMILFVGGIVAIIAMAVFGPISTAISQLG